MKIRAWLDAYLPGRLANPLLTPPDIPAKRALVPFTPVLPSFLLFVA